MATTFCRMVTHLEMLLTIKLCKTLKGYMRKKNLYICIARVPMATKLSSMMTYLDGLLPIKSHYVSITWPWKIT